MSTQSSNGFVFEKVLVANRGEIARRILRTLREMGLDSVAVFSDADADGAHVREADEAVRLGPAPSLESYLNQPAILEAARRTGAQAVHPGYGFLAENAEFARACRDAGLVFIGPTPEAIASMGHKAEAKALAAEAGVPILDGFALDSLGKDEIHARATELGFPLLIKASAGGGGKGMRVVRGIDELEDQIAAAARESKKAFGDDALLIERFLEAPRHIEIQILGDQHGKILHLFERDCSIQRRHQKIFEEAPSPAVTEQLRRRMGEAAIHLAKKVDYQGAGTVEFLLDSAAESGDFFFLEMNTRLQVEHPVTEAITGLDLVGLQIDIALGKPLALDQDQLEIHGHAVEARLYAEDTQADFLPASGRLDLWRVPELPGLRVDSGVEAGDQVTVHYDPLLAKIIAHGANREQALRRARRGLRELAVGGVTNNRDFLVRVLENEAFRAGHFSTHFLEENSLASVEPASDASPLESHAIAATLFLVLERRGEKSPLPASLPRGWRNHRWRRQDQVFQCGDQRLELRYLEKERSLFEIGLLDGEIRSVRLLQDHNGTGVLSLEIDGLRRPFHVARSPDRLFVHGHGQSAELEIVPRFPEKEAAAIAGGCAAPMTGLVVDILVEPGQNVEAGTPLVLLEAMKMEHRLEAAFPGVVESVHVKKGQMVDPDEVLVVVKKADSEGDDS